MRGMRLPPVFEDGEARGELMDWQNLLTQLAPLRRRWDTAVLANLPADDEGIRPVDLLVAINSQSSPEREISWKVLEDTLRRLVADGYVARKAITSVPRESRYWLLPPGHRLITALTLLEAWLAQDHLSEDWHA